MYSEWSGFQIARTKAIANPKAQPFEIRPSKSPDFEWSDFKWTNPLIFTLSYQVKESLNHVQVLLDHQLMDMAWSDNLTDCEENLLKLATHLQVRSYHKVKSARSQFKRRYSCIKWGLE